MFCSRVPKLYDGRALEELGRASDECLQMRGSEVRAEIRIRTRPVLDKQELRGILGVLEEAQTEAIRFRRYDRGEETIEFGHRSFDLIGPNSILDVHDDWRGRRDDSLLSRLQPPLEGSIGFRRLTLQNEAPDRQEERRRRLIAHSAREHSSCRSPAFGLSTRSRSHRE